MMIYYQIIYIYIHTYIHTYIHIHVYIHIYVYRGAEKADAQSAPLPCGLPVSVK